MQGALGDTIGLLPSAIWTVVKVAFKAAKDDDEYEVPQLFAFPHLSFFFLCCHCGALLLFSAAAGSTSINKTHMSRSAGHAPFNPDLDLRRVASAANDKLSHSSDKL